MNGLDHRGRLVVLLAVLLTTTSWLPLIVGSLWFWTTAITCALGAAAATLADLTLGRRWHTRWWGPAASLVLIVALAVAALVPAAGWIPTPSSLGTLGRLLADGISIVNTTTSPITPTPAVTAVVVVTLVGLWWAADTMSTALNTPAAGALALLAVYCVPSSILFAGVPWRQFVASTLGLVALLAVGNRDRLAQWGRRIDPPGHTTGPARLARGVAAGAISLILALVVPSMLPGLGGGLMAQLRSKDRQSASDALSTDLDLRRDLNRPTDRPLVRYTTTATDPGPLRMFTVTSLDDARWTLTDKRGAADASQVRYPATPPDLDPRLFTTRTQRFSATTVGLRQTYLPFPGRFMRFSATQGRWDYDSELGTISGPNPSSPQLRYTMSVVDVEPRGEALARRTAAASSPTVAEEYLALGNASTLLRETAGRVAGTGTDYVQAQRLQAWFRSGGTFSYSTEVSGVTTRSAIDLFLSERRGYCVHFATAMALMARQVGIPSRVAVGLLPGERDGTEWVASEQDAHAWPELYFDRVGWVRFEPTPATRTGTAPSWTVPDVTPSASPSRSTAAPTTRTRTVTATRAPTPTPSAKTAPQPGSRGVSVPWGRVAGWLSLVIAVLVMLTAPRLLAARIRHRRRARATDPAAADWEELTERLADLAIPADPTRTVRTQAQSVAADLSSPQARSALDRLADAVEQSLYRPGGSTSSSGGAADIRLVVSEVARRRPRWQRLSATWLPRAVFRRR